jgi:hypothetical protein
MLSESIWAQADTDSQHPLGLNPAIRTGASQEMASYRDGILDGLYRLQDPRVINPGWKVYEAL